MRRPLLPFLIIALFAAACGGGTTTVDGPGTLSLALTDDVAEELSQFEVDVRDVTLSRAGGATVSVLPRATRVDFVQLESLSELVAAVDLPAGAYTGIQLRLDFANAEVLLVGQASPATVRDRSGTAITGVVDVEIDLATRIVVRPARNNLCVLDLDLAQSLQVDAAANAVTFTPVWSTEIDPDDPKPLATNGLLQSVDVGAGTFVLERRNAAGEQVAAFTVATNNVTLFQIDGVTQAGALGLGNLVGSLGRRVFVQGRFDRGESVLRAVAVEAGAGVPGNGQDWVLGHVIGRTGGAGADPSLSVLGSSLDVATGTRSYNIVHTVALSRANSKVLRRATSGSLDSGDVNVGQLVWVFGELTGTSLDATADTGVVRMLRTGVTGIATTAPAAGVLTLDVARIDRRDINRFDFVVNGQSQANPDAMTIDVTGLDTTGIAAGSRLRTFVWFASVGASGPDAVATTLIDRTAAGRLLLCQWSPAEANVLASAGTGIRVDITNADLAVVADGIAPVTLTPTPVPSLQALGTTGFYRIVADRGLTSYRDFALFRSAVLTRAATDPVRWVTGAGRFEATTQAFSAVSATVVFD